MSVAVSRNAKKKEGMLKAYAWESTIVPQVAFVRKAVAHETQLALLDVLFDWIKEFFFRDLWVHVSQHHSSLHFSVVLSTYLQFGICPARDLYDHV